MSDAYNLFQLMKTLKDKIVKASLVVQVLFEKIKLKYDYIQSFDEQIGCISYQFDAAGLV